MWESFDEKTCMCIEINIQRNGKTLDQLQELKAVIRFSYTVCNVVPRKLAEWVEAYSVMCTNICMFMYSQTVRMVWLWIQALAPLWTHDIVVLCPLCV